MNGCLNNCVAVWHKEREADKKDRETRKLAQHAQPKADEGNEEDVTDMVKEDI